MAPDGPAPDGAPVAFFGIFRAADSHHMRFSGIWGVIGPSARRGGCRRRPYGDEAPG